MAETTTVPNINLIITNDSVTVVTGAFGAMTEHDATPPGLHGEGCFRTNSDDVYIYVGEQHPDYPHSSYRATIASVLADAPEWETLPVAFRAEALQRQFIDHMRWLARHWATTPGGGSVQERLDGLLHSVLATIDGSGDFPCRLDLVCRPHPDDKAYHIAQGEKWAEDGTVLNAGVMLHELLRDPGSVR